LVGLQGQAKWIEETLIKIIISEGQNEVVADRDLLLP